MVVWRFSAAQAEVQAAHLQVAARQRMLAGLEERERIGRELHDGLGQVVAYVALQAQAVVTLLEQVQSAQAPLCFGRAHGGVRTPQVAQGSSSPTCRPAAIANCARIG